MELLMHLMEISVVFLEHLQHLAGYGITAIDAGDSPLSYNSNEAGGIEVARLHCGKRFQERLLLVMII